MAAIRCSLDPQPTAPSSGSGSDSTPPPPLGGGEPPLPPEQELEDVFRVPVATGRFVWTANPESNRVALIDATDFSVATLDAGFAPTTLAALPNQVAERSGAVYADTEENVAKRFANRGQMQDGKLTQAAQKQAQRKYVDPNGIKFDIVNDEHARNSWRLPV